MKISVCIASYNGEAYLIEQLNSIIDQLGSHDYEILLSDDGSTDDTILLIQGLNIPKLKLLNGPRLGLIKNFENSLNHASGDIIFLSDQDDIWLPNKVNHCVKLLKKYDLIVSNAQVVDADLNMISPSFFQGRLSGKGVAKNLYKNTYLGCCMAFNRSVLKAVLPFPESIAMHDWWIGLVADSISNVKFTETPLILYRRHGMNASDTSESSSSTMLTKLQWRIKMLSSLLGRIIQVKV